MHYLNLIREYKKDDFELSTDREKLNIPFIHGFLCESYWSPGISIGKIQDTIDNTFCFGLYDGEQQIGFANVVTDFSRFAYLCNVFIIPHYRGQGLAKWMLGIILNMPELQVSRWMLGTRDMHLLYEKFGFHALSAPERMMEKRKEG